MPEWVTQGYQSYASRLASSDFQLNLIEISAQKRGKNAPISKILEQEGEALLSHAGTGDLIIALDREGKAISTKKMAIEKDDSFKDLTVEDPNAKITTSLISNRDLFLVSFNILTVMDI